MITRQKYVSPKRQSPATGCRKPEDKNPKGIRPNLVADFDRTSTRRSEKGGGGVVQKEINIDCSYKSK
jgi:hypothetical protein